MVLFDVVDYVVVGNDLFVVIIYNPLELDEFWVFGDFVLVKVDDFDDLCANPGAIFLWGHKEGSVLHFFRGKAFFFCGVVCSETFCEGEFLGISWYTFGFTYVLFIIIHGLYLGLGTERWIIHG